MFLIESTSYLKPVCCFTVRVFFPLYFNKRHQRLAGMLGFIEITEHKHIHVMLLSIQNYCNQCTLKQSKDWLKIFRTLRCSKLTGVQKLFPLCAFSFHEKQQGHQWLTNIGLTDMKQQQNMLFRLRFSLTISYPSLSLKSLWRFIITCNPRNVVYMKTY